MISAVVGSFGLPGQLTGIPGFATITAAHAAKFETVTTPQALDEAIASARQNGKPVVLDFSAECAADADFLLTADHIKAWEATHGAIPAGAWALFRTDWSKRAPDAYTNRREDGAHTPGPAPDAIEYLIARDVLGFGVETIGTDAGQAHLLTPPYPAHSLLHGAGKYGLQCLENLDRLPPTGAIVVAAPLKIRDGTGSPLRVLALIAN